MAREYYYYNVIRKTIIQFLDLFNDIQVARYRRDGMIEKYVDVPIKLWAKEKAWYWINERKDDETLPIISAQMLSIEYDTQRQTNPYQKITCEVDETSGQRSDLINPRPYNIGFSLSIWSKYMVDVDQILEQILPWFGPHVMMKVNINEIGVSFDAKVIFQAATPEILAEMVDDQYRVIQWNIDFQIQTYLFLPIRITEGLAKKIFINEYLTDEAWANRSTTSTFSSGASGEALEKMIKAVYPFYDNDGNKVYEYEQFGAGEPQ